MMNDIPNISGKIKIDGNQSPPTRNQWVLQKYWIALPPKQGKPSVHELPKRSEKKCVNSRSPMPIPRDFPPKQMISPLEFPWNTTKKHGDFPWIHFFWKHGEFPPNHGFFSWWFHDVPMEFPMGNSTKKSHWHHTSPSSSSPKLSCRSRRLASKKSKRSFTRRGDRFFSWDRTRSGGLTHVRWGKKHQTGGTWTGKNMVNTCQNWQSGNERHSFYIKMHSTVQHNGSALQVLGSIKPLPSSHLWPSKTGHTDLAAKLDVVVPTWWFIPRIVSGL